MKYVLSLLLGAAIGAAIALLFAPETGDDLRANIKLTADTQSAKLQEEVQAGMKQLQASLDKLSSDLQAMKNKSKEIEPAA